MHLSCSQQRKLSLASFVWFLSWNSLSLLVFHSLPILSRLISPSTFDLRSSRSPLLRRGLEKNNVYWEKVLHCLLQMPLCYEAKTNVHHWSCTFNNRMWQFYFLLAQWSAEQQTFSSQHKVVTRFQHSRTAVLLCPIIVSAQPNAVQLQWSTDQMPYFYKAYKTLYFIW